MFQRVLALSPHTDDVEIACGAVVAKLIDHGAKVDHIAFSWCANHQLKDEWIASNHALGVNSAYLSNFPRRTFPARRQDILQLLCDWRNNNQPYDLVLCPCSTDIHQDHQVIHQEALRAFRRTSTLWGYIMPWNTLPTCNPTLYVSLDPRHITKQKQALDHYTTQHHLPQLKHAYQTHSKHITSATLGRTDTFTQALEILRWIW